MINSTTGSRPLRTKTLDTSKWLSDLREVPVMVSYEVPESQVDLANSEVLCKTIQRFRNAGLHSATPPCASDLK